jgi:hypothetical protein
MEPNLSTDARSVRYFWQINWHFWQLSTTACSMRFEELPANLYFQLIEENLSRSLKPSVLDSLLWVSSDMLSSSVSSAPAPFSLPGANTLFTVHIPVNNILVGGA